MDKLHPLINEGRVRRMFPGENEERLWMRVGEEWIPFPNRADFDNWLRVTLSEERKDERSCIIDKLHAERAWLVSTGNEDNIRDAEGILAAITVIKGMK